MRICGVVGATAWVMHGGEIWRLGAAFSFASGFAKDRQDRLVILGH